MIDSGKLTLFTDDIINDKGQIELRYIGNDSMSRNISLPERFRVKILVCYDESAIINSVIF